MTSPTPSRSPLGAGTVACFLALAASSAAAQPGPAAPVAAATAHAAAPTLRAVPRTAPIRLDGVLDEAVGTEAPAAKDFRQRDPNEGQPATQRTEVRFAYDDDAL